MKSFFQMDNPLFQILQKILNVVGLSLVWILCCLPVVTIGAATAALYYTTVKVVRNERGYLFAEYFSAFKKNFRQSTIATLVYLAITALFYFDVRILQLLRGEVAEAGAREIGTYCVIIVLSLYYVLLLLQMSRFANSLKTLAKNTLILMIRHLPASLLTLLIITFGFFAAWLIPLFAIIMPTVAAWLVSIPMEKVYHRYMTPEEQEWEDKLNLIKS